MIKHALLAAAFGFVPFATAAALLDVTPATPSVSDAGAAFQFPGAGFTFAGAPYTLTADILVDGTIGGFGGDLVSAPDAATALSGSLTSFGYAFAAEDTDVLQFLFTLDGNSDTAFGNELLAVVSGEFGAEPSFGVGFEDAAATATFSAIGADVAPIPLPAGGLLLLTGLGALALRRR